MYIFEIIVIVLLLVIIAILLNQNKKTIEVNKETYYEYYIDIKLTSNELVKTYTTKLKFSVVNQVDNLH